MAFTAHNPRVFYDAIVARIATSTGRTVGNAVAPASNPFPYAVVYPQDETDVESSLADPHDLTVFEWLVISIAGSSEQSLWMLQKVRVALLGWQPVVSGVTCNFVLRDGGSGVNRNDAIQPPEFSASDRYVCLAD